MKPLERLSYDVTQGARVAWFIGQYLTTARLSRPTLRRIDWPKGLPDRRLIMRDLRALFLRDRANIDAGVYRLPDDMVVNPIDVLRKSGLYFRDLAEVNARRLREDHQEVHADADADERLPRYYRQNFHYQTGGYLTDASARLYDYQVEVLFAGGADAMRRQALVPLHHFLKDRPVGRTKLLDVACGTGRFLGSVLHNYPRLDVTGVDLSTPYLDEAGRRLRRSGAVRLVEGAAEDLPFADASHDVLTCVYLFHELPRKVRAQAASEFARVLKPGGRLIFVESIQKGDHPPFDALLDAFPLTHHEPYYADYVTQDLDALFGAGGLVPVGHERAHMSKVSVFEKPAAGGA